MKQKIKIQITSEDGDPFFGIGVSELLHKVEQTGSLNQAAKNMQMSYNKACRMIHKTEKILSYRLTERVSGGKNGGGSILTREGKYFLTQFDAYQEKMQQLSEEVFHDFFRILLDRKQNES